MYELVKVGKNTYYFDVPAKVGVYTNATGAHLIDSGSDKDAAWKIMKKLDEAQMTIQTITNTHSHADHIGGNATLFKKTGCKIYAPPLECYFIENTIMETSFLFSATPPKVLQNKYFMAKESVPIPLSVENIPEGMCALDFKGHSGAMTGIRTSDDIYFLGDALVGANILQKYHITYLYNLAWYLETLEYIGTLEGALFIPAHGPAVRDIRPLAKENKDKAFEIMEAIVNICKNPVPFDTVLSQLFFHFGLKMSFGQYVLSGCTIKAYLSYLMDHGQVEAVMDAHQLLWQSTK